VAGKLAARASSHAHPHRGVVPREAQTWEKGDLLRRVSRALDFAAQAVQSLPTDGWPEAEGAESQRPLGALYEKVVAETAMLLISAASVQDVDKGIEERVRHLAAHLIPLARSESMLAGICADPGRAAHLAVAHAVLSRLGYTDALVDQLLVESTALGDQFGAELPQDRLELEWVTRMWGGRTPARPERGLLARSMLGRRLDILGCGRFDVYSFTHAIMYANDFGGRRASLPRPSSAIAADADAALALSLDIDDFDVTAEVAMTWPLLSLAWSPAATFAFGLLAAADDELGFVPGPTFNPKHYEASMAGEQTRHSLATSYHTTYMMGILCAAVLRRRCFPFKTVPLAGSAGCGLALARLLDRDIAEPRWRAAFDALGPGQQNAVAPLVVTVLLRRAKDRGDLRRVRTVLELALTHGLAEGPAVQQAVALLRRSAFLSRIVSDKCRTPIRPAEHVTCARGRPPFRKSNA
jgi:hypothetical protein